MRTIVLCCFSLLFAIQAEAQVAVVNYMKVKSGNGNAFISNEREWKKLHQKRVNEGKMLSWHLFGVMGSGTGSPYNYVTVDIYSDMKSALQGITEDELKKAFGDKYNDLMTKTGAARDMVYSDISNWQMGIMGKQPDKYLRVSKMKTKQAGYFEMEEKAYKPVHQAMVDMGKLNSWSVWGRPFWDDMSYNAITVNGYVSAEQMSDSGYSDEVFQKATAGKKSGEMMEMTNYFNTTNEYRDMVQSQLWEVIDQTTPAPPKK